MIKKKDIYDKIVHELSIYINDIEEKSKNNLLDDNVFSEDFIKNLLNICMGWNLINLNKDTNRYPGIDLGDRERRIGVQVTSTKTSQKIIDSLDKIVGNNVDKDYDEIYFFILGRKQKSYSVDFTKYDTLDCSVENIWDVSDIIAWCTHYDYVHMEQVWDVIKKEIVVSDAQFNISIETKKRALELKRVVNKIFKTTSQLIQTHYEPVDYIDEMVDALSELDQMLPYLDEITYFVCKEVLQEGIELGEILQTYHTWTWNIEARCIRMMYKKLVEKNLQEVSELLDNDILGLQKGLGIIIDGDSLYDRLIGLDIDQDILYNQFSISKFQNIIENTILRKCKKSSIVFSKNGRHYNEELVRRLEAEGIYVLIFEDRQKTIEFMCEQIKETFEFVLVGYSDDLINNISKQNVNCYLYTVSFMDDLLTSSAPIFFSKGNITSIGLNNCFNYNECKTTNIKNINEEIYKDMLANANDCISHQLRVDWSGDVYISTITGAEDIDGVKFRWESWDPGNGYVGPRAASDYEYVKKSVISLKKCWEDGVRGYCDYYAIY